MEKIWSVNVEGITYNVEFKKNKVYIDGVHLKPLKKAKGGNYLESAFEVPLGNVMAVIYIPGTRGHEPVLTINGYDVLTNQPYEPVKAPKWVWAFAVLYIVNFALFLGGALGGALNAFLFFITANMSARSKMPTIAKVLIAIGIWVVSAVIEAFIAMAIVGALQ